MVVPSTYLMIMLFFRVEAQTEVYNEANLELRQHPWEAHVVTESLAETLFPILTMCVWSVSKEVQDPGGIRTLPALQSA